MRQLPRAVRILVVLAALLALLGGSTASDVSAAATSETVAVQEVVSSSAEVGTSADEISVPTFRPVPQRCWRSVQIEGYGRHMVPCLNPRTVRRGSPYPASVPPHRSRFGGPVEY